MRCAQNELKKYVHRKGLSMINVWYGTNENKELSNLFESRFEDRKGRKYVSVEHAYQTWKSGSFDEVYHKPWRCGSKFIGRKKADFNNNIEIMEKIMRQRFISNPEHMDILLATGTDEITHTQDRGVWRKEFPRLLMKLREEFRASSDKGGAQ